MRVLLFICTFFLASSCLKNEVLVEKDLKQKTYYIKAKCTDC